MNVRHKNTKKQKITVPPKRCGTLQKKVLLLLLAGVAFGLSRSPRQQYKIATSLPEEFKKLGKNVPRAVRTLYESKLVKKIKNKDGTVTFILSDQGKKQALTYNLEKLKLPTSKQWDKKWRIVMYDIPEEYKSGRDALRRTLICAGMYELQQSVFVYPHDCKKEVDYVLEFYNLRRYVRYALVDFIDNELHIKREFNM